MDKWAVSETFEDYTQTLILECESDREQPANLTWTVPLNAPNTLYYQVINIKKLIFLLIHLIIWLTKSVFLSVTRTIVWDGRLTSLTEGSSLLKLVGQLLRWSDSESHH